MACISCKDPNYIQYKLLTWENICHTETLWGSQEYSPLYQLHVASQLDPKVIRSERHGCWWMLVDVDGC